MTNRRRSRRSWVGIKYVSWENLEQSNEADDEFIDNFDAIKKSALLTGAVILFQGCANHGNQALKQETEASVNNKIIANKTAKHIFNILFGSSASGTKKELVLLFNDDNTVKKYNMSESDVTVKTGLFNN